MQDKITLGGNLAGTIIYRESVLPLMVSDGKVVLDGPPEGKRTAPVMEVFKEGTNLRKGEMVVQIIVDEKYLNLPYIHVKRTKNEKIDYPLITLVSLVDNGRIKMAFSGLCGFPPFRSVQLEDILNDNSIPKDERIKKKQS